MKKSLFLGVLLVLFFLSSINLYAKPKKVDTKKKALPGITFEACCENSDSAKVSDVIMKKFKGKTLTATQKCQFAQNVTNATKKEQKGKKLVEKTCPEPKKIEPKAEPEEEESNEEGGEGLVEDDE